MSDHLDVISHNAMAPRRGWEERLARIAIGSLRIPYFQVYGRRYSAPALSTREDMVGQKVVVWIRYSDSRIEAAFLDGKPIEGLQLIGGKLATWLPLRQFHKLSRSTPHDTRVAAHGQSDLAGPSHLCDARRTAFTRQGQAPGIRKARSSCQRRGPGAARAPARPAQPLATRPLGDPLISVSPVRSRTTR